MDYFFFLYKLLFRYSRDWISEYSDYKKINMGALIFQTSLLEFEYSLVE
jgi:hypothetical protein